MKMINPNALKDKWCAECDNKGFCNEEVGWCDSVKELFDMPTIELKLPITPEDFRDKMKYINYEANHYDAEMPHVLADNLMCEILSKLGYGEGVELFKDMKRWYS